MEFRLFLLQTIPTTNLDNFETLLKDYFSQYVSTTLNSNFSRFATIRHIKRSNDNSEFTIYFESAKNDRELAEIANTTPRIGGVDFRLEFSDNASNFETNILKNHLVDDHNKNHTNNLNNPKLEDEDEEGLIT